ncbi:MAG TPA: NRDE family protein, partial [Thermoanaerobaculia bacterium]|nr:NRDE family protein [Thermoanaerobaculia bacterium]
MCTVSWFWTAEGYQLFGNRDESRSRRQALPPRRAEQDGVAYLAPVDADAGGTWIAANELGVTLTLLNFYQADAVGLGQGIAGLPQQVDHAPGGHRSVLADQFGQAGAAEVFHHIVERAVL